MSKEFITEKKREMSKYRGHRTLWGPPQDKQSRSSTNTWSLNNNDFICTKVLLSIHWNTVINKDVIHIIISPKTCKLKQCDTTTHQLEWPKSKTLTPNAGEDVERRELSITADESAKWYRHLEDSLAVSYKTKHILTIQSSNRAPWYLPKEVENLWSHKNLHTDVYGSFIHTCQYVEATNMSFSRWVNRLFPSPHVSGRGKRTFSFLFFFFLNISGHSVLNKAHLQKKNYFTRA